MIGSILIGAAIYMLVQIAFIGSISPDLLASQHRWANLGSANTDPTVVTLNAGPFFTVARIAGLSWLAFVLRLDAVYLPVRQRSDLPDHVLADQLRPGPERLRARPFGHQTSGRRVPVFGVLVATLIGLLFLLPFPSWGKLVNVVTALGADVRRRAARARRAAQGKAGPAAVLPAAARRASSRRCRSYARPGSSTGRAGSRSRRSWWQCSSAT